MGDFPQVCRASTKGRPDLWLRAGGNNNIDAIDLHGALFRSYGASLIDNEGSLQLDSDAIHQVLEFGQRLVKFYLSEAVSFDDASNNRALISDRSALICNPPSAWAVAKRDAPSVAADCWTFPVPKRPKGRFVPTASFFSGVYSFSQNKTAAKELIEYLMQRPQVEVRRDVVAGYDLPLYGRLNDFKVWAEVEPPSGTVYNYPIRPWHDQHTNLTASEAPPDVGRLDLQPRDPQSDAGAPQGGPDHPSGDRMDQRRATGTGSPALK